MDVAFQTVDVFAATRFGGNPLAVVLDADALTDGQMQAITREFNYAETTFVCRPTDPRHTARVRIFTPGGEVPFAGHPNIGTAHVLAGLPAHRTATAFTFEEAAGLVPLTIARDGDQIRATRLTAPQPLSIGAEVAVDHVASALSLPRADIVTTRHPPCFISVGLPFLAVELASRTALSRATAHAAAFPGPDAPSRMIWLYTRDISPADGDSDLTARMFAPFDGVPEDPATGSATAAACALLATLSDRRAFHVAQGVDMGRPSALHVTIDDTGTHLAGSSIPVMKGILTV